MSGRAWVAKPAQGQGQGQGRGPGGGGWVSGRAWVAAFLCCTFCLANTDLTEILLQIPPPTPGQARAGAVWGAGRPRSRSRMLCNT